MAKGARGWWESDRNLGLKGTVAATLIAAAVWAVLVLVPVRRWAAAVWFALAYPVPVPLADSAALTMMTDDVLSADVIERARGKLVALPDGPEEDTAEKRARLTATVSRTKVESEKLADAVAAGGELPVLLERLRVCEREKRTAETELRALAVGPTVRAAAPEIRREALRLLDDWRGLLGRNVGTSRQLLRKLLNDGSRFVFSPMADATSGERWYEIAAVPSLDKLFAAVPTLKKAVASPTGFEPVFWP